jgi:hypothetical protein
MVSASVETTYFDSCKQDLLDHHAGKFAIVCGRKLFGVHDTLDRALRAAGEAFGDGLLEDGAPILITEIAEPAKVRVVAEPRSFAR